MHIHTFNYNQNNFQYLVWGRGKESPVCNPGSELQLTINCRKDRKKGGDSKNGKRKKWCSCAPGPGVCCGASSVPHTRTSTQEYPQIEPGIQALGFQFVTHYYCCSILHLEHNLLVAAAASEGTRTSVSQEYHDDSS